MYSVNTSHPVAHQVNKHLRWIRQASAAYTGHVASMRAPQVTLEERGKKVTAGPAGKERSNGGVSPFQHLTKLDLIKECRGRNLPTDGLLKPSL